MAWIECLNILQNLKVGDATVKHCFRPGCSSTLQLDKLLQLQPELSLTESLWFFWIFYLIPFGTPGSLSYYLDKHVTAHGAPDLIAR